MQFYTATIPVLSVAAMEKCCNACGDRVNYFRTGCLVSSKTSFKEASIVVNRKSMGPTVAERSLKDADYLCVS
jgi:hypothetical protein